MLVYTDWFPLVGGLLGLGGLFAWAGFVAGLLSDERKRELQAVFEHRLLGRAGTPLGLLVLLAALLLWASLHGSVRLDSRGDDHGRLAWIQQDPFRSNPPLPANGYAAPRSLQTFSIFTGWRPRPVYVKVAGLPVTLVTVSPFRRATLTIPDSLERRPIVLIRPAPRVSTNAERFRFDLAVTLNAKYCRSELR
jgi:hypothetical protein